MKEIRKDQIGTTHKKAKSQMGLYTPMNEELKRNEAELKNLKQTVNESISHSHLSRFKML